MENIDMSYFWELQNDFSKLPVDLRKKDFSQYYNKQLTENDVRNIVGNTFKKELINFKYKKEIFDIIRAVIQNEKSEYFQILNISRFSIVFKNNTKVLKIGFPKITYKIPKCSIILDSIIRKQYDEILFIEVQDFKSSNLSDKYSKEEIEEILYNIWKKFRMNNIIWYDPKEKNVVLENDTNNINKWDNCNYYQSNDKEKGIYKVPYDINYLNLKIVDTDLFLPLDVIQDFEKLCKTNPNASGFSNWKYKTLMEYEKRYKGECMMNEKKQKLIKEIEVLNNSDEIKNFVCEVKKLCIDNGAYFVTSRIKSTESAIESFNDNKSKQIVNDKLYKTVILTNPDTVKSFESVETIVDLLGIRVITLDNNTLYKIVNLLKEKYNSYLSIDLISDRLVGFEYRAVHIYFKLNFPNISFEVPLEIQLKTYEMHYAWEALHDTIYKNQKINFYDGCNLLPTLFKIFEYNGRAIKEYLLQNEMRYNFIAIENIIKYNQNLFLKYKKEIEKACFLFAKSIYYEKNNELTEIELLNKFNQLKETKNIKNSPLHIFGDKGIEFATFCIATNSME